MINDTTPLPTDPSPPSWYLDPLAAAQKREVHQRLVRRWVARPPRLLLKTDVFEEAFGEDRILFDLFPDASLAAGMDIAPAHAAAARRLAPGPRFAFAVCDVRRAAFRSCSFDLILSNSTLDHFDSLDDLRASLNELARMLAPGGTLIVTLDNPANPLYPLLAWLSRRRFAPFSLGRTASLRQLNCWLAEAGLTVTANDWLIHNPRLVSTALFLLLRRLFGRRADHPIRALLAAFDSLGRLPTRPLTACFLAACARKPPFTP